MDEDPVILNTDKLSFQKCSEIRGLCEAKLHVVPRSKGARRIFRISKPFVIDVTEGKETVV